MYVWRFCHALLFLFKLNLVSSSFTPAFTRHFVAILYRIVIPYHEFDISLPSWWPKFFRWVMMVQAFICEVLSFLGPTPLGKVVLYEDPLPGGICWGVNIAGLEDWIMNDVSYRSFPSLFQVNEIEFTRVTLDSSQAAYDGTCRWCKLTPQRTCSWDSRLPA